MACIDDLASAKAAYSALLRGELIVQTTVNGITVKYSAADMDKLQKHIRELEAECGELDANGRNPSRRAPIMFHG